VDEGIGEEPEQLSLFELPSRKRDKDWGRRYARLARRCERCGMQVPRCEDESYWRSDLCGWCEHQYQKNLKE